MRMYALRVVLVDGSSTSVMCIMQFARQSHPNPQHRYSERLFTIAGIGAVFDSTLDRKPSNVTLLTSEIVINIPCSASKINSHKLLTTADIIKRSWTILSAEAVAIGSPTVTLRLRFFSNIHGGKRVAIAALVAQLKRSLANPSIAPPGAVAIEVLPTLARQEFIAKSAEGHLALDSYPFGGCLTVIVRAVMVSLCRPLSVHWIALCICLPVGHVELWSSHPCESRRDVEQSDCTGYPPTPRLV